MTRKNYKLLSRLHWCRTCGIPAWLADRFWYEASMCDKCKKAAK